MRQGARTPEELENLLEDSFIVRDVRALTSLFDESAVLVGGGHEARGGEEIARVAAAMWSGDGGYVADVRRVLQAGDTALCVSRGVHVLRRSGDGLWRYVISMMDAPWRAGQGADAHG